MELKTVVEMGSSVIVALSALVASIVGVKGINAWRRQTIDKAKYDLARRYLLAVYKLRDATQIVRNPFISPGEMIESAKKVGIPEDDLKDNAKMNSAVYSSRWNAISEAVVELQVEQREAEVMWGREAVDIEKDLDKLIRELRGHIQMMIRGHQKNNTDEIIYFSGDKDAFTIKIDEAVDKIVMYLKPHLFLR
jgi:hypothetical protein